jgi:hypothetical protein
MLTVKYLSKETYQEELASDIDYNNLEDKLERYPQINEFIPDYNNIRMSETGKYSVSKLDESFITTSKINAKSTILFFYLVKLNRKIL